MPIITEIIEMQQPGPHERKRRDGKRGPGKFYLHGGERSEFVRQALAQLPEAPNRALVVEFESPAERAAYQLIFHNVNRTAKSLKSIPVKTRAQGNRLYVWRKTSPEQLVLL